MIRSRDIDNRRFIFTKVQSIALLAHYFIGYILVYPMIVKAIDGMIWKSEGGIHPKLHTAYVLFMILTSFAIIKDPLLRSARFFKLHLKENMKLVGRNYLYLIGMNFLINFVIIFVFKIENQSENQQIVVEMIRQSFVPMFLSTVIFAPLVEEVVFRGVLYQNLRSKKYFYLPMIISMLVFSSMHLIVGLSAGNGWMEFIFIFQYAGLSFFMIRAMEATNNIFGSILIHFINNGLAFATVFLVINVLV